MVLPSLNICLSNPAAAGCAVVSLPSQDQSSYPVATALGAAVNAINAATSNLGGATVPDMLATVEKKDETKDSSKAQQASTEKPEATHEAIKKTYCN